jgi:hypothetical protein
VLIRGKRVLKRKTGRANILPKSIQKTKMLCKIKQNVKF